MTDNYSLLEVFEQAEQIERNGHSFYTQAAEATDDASVKAVLMKLAAEELHHQSYFHNLREQFCKREEAFYLDPDGEATAYLRSAADTHVFTSDQAVADLLGSIQSARSAIKLAIDFEKDTIVFFSALKDAVEAQDREKVELLIQEELRHVRILQEELVKLL